MIDEKVKIKCTKCSQVFRERAQKIRNGFQANCQHCNRLRSLPVRKIGISAGLSCAPKRWAWRLRNVWRKARPAIDSPLREMAVNHAFALHRLMALPGPTRHFDHAAITSGLPEKQIIQSQSEAEMRFVHISEPADVLMLARGLQHNLSK